jgi:hypothetical protein
MIKVQKRILQFRLKGSERTIKKAKDRIAEIDKEVDKFLTAFANSNSTVITVIEQRIEALGQEKLELNQQILESDSITIENQINDMDELLLDMQSAIKDEYTFEEALKYIGKITYTNGELEYYVVANEELEPLLNIPIERVGQWDIDKSIVEMTEVNEQFKALKNQIHGK